LGIIGGMNDTLVSFLAQAAVVSLSGALAPGPVTTATLVAGARSRHAGAWIAVGHGVLEFPLMGLIMLGAGAILQLRGFRIGIGMIGGVMLLFMAAMMLRDVRRPAQQSVTVKSTNPVWIGIALTGGNPYFLLWWATVGLALASRAMTLGVLAFGLFAIVHWLCDLVWLEALSLASYSGIRILGPRSQQWILAICSAAMAFFGLYFLWDAAWLLAG